jgi:hypothetical protein
VEAVVSVHETVPVENDNSINVYILEPSVQYREVDMFQESFSPHVYQHAIVHTFLDLDAMRRYSFSAVEGT